MNLAGKRLGIVLFASLLLNAFLLGGLVVHFARGHRGPPDQRSPFATTRDHHRRGPPPGRWAGRGPAETQLLRDVVRALGGPRDPRVQAALSDGRPRMSDHRERLARAQAGVRTALAGEPFEAAQLEQALAQLRRATDANQKQAQDTLIALAAQLRADERASLRSGSAPPKTP